LEPSRVQNNKFNIGSFVKGRNMNYASHEISKETPEKTRNLLFHEVNLEFLPSHGRFTAKIPLPWFSLVFPNVEFCFKSL